MTRQSEWLPFAPSDELVSRMWTLASALSICSLVDKGELELYRMEAQSILRALQAEGEKAAAGVALSGEGPRP